MNTAKRHELRPRGARPPIALEYPTVSDERSEEQAPGVFGNLPASRPGTRSPRRESEPAAGAPGPPEPEPAREPFAAEATAAEPDPPPPHAAGAGEEESGDGSGLEDLAWAGVAVAAEVATLGVRLATRAVEALLGAPRP